MSRFPGGRHRDALAHVLLSVEDDVRTLTDTLARILAKLDAETLQFQKEEPGDATPPEQPQEELSDLDPPGTPRPLDAQPAADSSSERDEKGLEPVEDPPPTDGVLQDNQRHKEGGTSGKVEDGDLIVG